MTTTNDSTATDFWVSTRAVDDDTVVYVNGDLDLATVPVLEAALTACLRTSPPAIAVDLDQVPFMSCLAIRSLLDWRARAAAQSSLLRVTRPSRAVDRLLTPDLRRLLLVEHPPRATVGVPTGTRVLECLECRRHTDHAKGPTSRRSDGSLLLQWWTCLVCVEGHTIG